jgi:hypothetical protein
MRDTIDMAREAGFETMLTKGKIHGFDRDGDYTEELKAFEALIRADEREACAKVCDDLAPPCGYNLTEISFWDVTSLECATAIRARGTHD